MQTKHAQPEGNPASLRGHAPKSKRCPEIGRNVIEMRPPGKARREVRGNYQAVEPEYFPLVSAAHEFKTPLVAMLGYTDLLRSARLGPVNEKQRQVLGEIQESAERLQRLIQDLLLLFELRAARGAANQRENVFAQVNDHVEEIFNYWAATAQLKSIAYRFSPSPGHPRVRIEPLKLQHIVSNLIENALKFTPAEGRVTVSVTQCFWERREAHSELLFSLERAVKRRVVNAVRIDVSDSGPGIPRDHQEDIFLDFVQLPGASSRGTGLGLAIARRLTEAHGGAIWVESEPGKGSRFSLLLSQTSTGRRIRTP
jgi:two-component system, NarL family, sensor histidine kinase BarA